MNRHRASSTNCVRPAGPFFIGCDKPPLIDAGDIAPDADIHLFRAFLLSEHSAAEPQSKDIGVGVGIGIGIDIAQ
jgi:hypothetical protein